MCCAIVSTTWWAQRFNDPEVSSVFAETWKGFLHVSTICFNRVHFMPLHLPLRHTQARPAELIFLAITRFNWWNRTKSTSSTTTVQLCPPRGETKTGKKHEETDFYKENGKAAQRRRQRGRLGDLNFFASSPLEFIGWIIQLKHRMWHGDGVRYLQTNV